MLVYLSHQGKLYTVEREVRMRDRGRWIDQTVTVNGCRYYAAGLGEVSRETPILLLDWEKLPRGAKLVKEN